MWNTAKATARAKACMPKSAKKNAKAKAKVAKSTKAMKVSVPKDGTPMAVRSLENAFVWHLKFMHDLEVRVTALEKKVFPEGVPPALPATSPATPSVPTIPANLVATPGNALVKLTWSATPSATSYTVKVGATTGGPYLAVESGLTKTSFTHSSLTNGTTYFYVVSALNASGESPNSTQASATPVAPR